jgi:AcrR family transcriptional regulator
MEIRQRIIDSCRELAHKKGFRSLTVDEIARWAGVSKRTVYRRFSSKDEILEAVVDDFLQAVAQQSDQVIHSGQDVTMVMRQMMNYLITGDKSIISQRVLEDLSRYYPQLWQKIDDFRMDRIKLVIALAEQQRSIRTEVDPLIFSTIILLAIKTIIDPEFLVKNQLNFQDAMEQLIAIFLPSLVLPSDHEP